MTHWALIEMDLQDLGIDVGDTAVMRTRSWRWLRLRIEGLLSAPGTALLVGHDEQGFNMFEPIYPNRIQSALFAKAK